MIRDKKIVALCTSRIYDSQTHFFIEKLNEAFRPHNIRLLIFTINSALYWDETSYFPETHVFDLIPYSAADAVIIMDEKIKSRRVAEKIIAEAKAHSVPVEVIDGKYNDSCSVHFDYEKGFEQIVRHVIEFHKVRRPHMMAGKRGNAFSDKRIAVFKKVIGENGIPFTENMLSYGDYWAVPARAAAKKVIDSGDIPEAFICANDIMAINVSSVLSENGFSVPSDVIVTGFDGYYETKLIRPRISTVNCRIDGIAKLTADICKDLIDGKNIPRINYMNPEPEFDESCGCESCGNSSSDMLDRFNDNFYRYQDDVRVFHDISMKVQTSASPEKAVSFLKHEIMHDMCCVINRLCLCRDINYFKEYLYEPFDEMCVIYDSYDESLNISAFDFYNIVPNLEKRLESGMPLIFNILDFMEKPMGFICYSFPDYNITDYSKTSCISDSISMGLGGFINMRYQQYLSDKITEMYKNDPLTGLYNRTGFNSAFDKLKREHSDSDISLIIIMADLDGLKSINDNYGHDAGDKAIAATAAALKQACPKEALCMRFGGDEMIAVIFGEIEEKTVTGKIEQFLEDFNKNSGLPYTVSASCGMYRTRLTENLDLEEAVRRADEKMYTQKKAKKAEISKEDLYEKT